ncbi:MAG: hypothetical protein QNJ30_15910 [Kiloniellales bacterium]|nr:hypothetical protein [Kiloniellales bacterium]
MEGDALSKLESGVVRYYTDRLKRFGATPLGVDWSCIASQELRFLQLMKLCDFAAPFSLNDVGCGYGALVGYLAKRHPEAGIDYLGIDLAAAMKRRAERLWRACPWAAFVTGTANARVADYSVASGIFNVKLEQPRPTWERFVALTLDEMHAASRKGFAVNFMLPRDRPPDSAAERDLYRSRPETWIRHCERAYGASVTLLDDYGQPEFTLLVRRRGSAS